MSDLGVWREQRRQDRLADREQDRADRAAQAEARREARRLEREQDREDRAAARGEKRQDKADRAARWRAGRAWVVANGALICTGIVMACAIVPALVSQFTALSTAGLGPLLAALLAAMLEGGAWAATFGAAKAAREGQPTGRYRAATWACALVAAAVNFWHGSGDYGLWLGVVLATASLFAVGMWELHLHGTHTPSAEERERSRHARRRRWHHRTVCRTADRLITAAPFGTLPAENAFAAAWHVRHGAAPGLTADLLTDRLGAESRLGAVIESAADTGPQRVTARLWTTGGDALPVLGPTCPLPIPNQEEPSPAGMNQSKGELQESTLPGLDRSADRSGETALDPAPIGPARLPAQGLPRRRPTGPVPEAARTPRPSRTWAELLDTARSVTAGWTDGELSAEALRKTLRTAPARARELRDALRDERASKQGAVA
ncbi:DUF2637 domain-containing protein [Streptomyces albireticuli]|uniref:DUF2637 domain-containing protein n=1 Tax=Streptomyces albireticuli TaxID=1940 RepID=A0A2A2D4Y9_9ACTN|nr:DUF2637 domain-containing protein [Streptomyces albireticuli]MCD9144362.1 DUF2637 domain-containing protein [Streptomyces albireticuli]MCD9161995.1 DUF2637 domain-containing protein [Streptomyces albireticuli]MCD9193999.1 DUF2637 domain-containing protein [Streptomyces albireticuli]PAU47513.1 hypothetical protein CK936_18125 [Streptomyces albireticuli]